MEDHYSNNTEYQKDAPSRLKFFILTGVISALIATLLIIDSVAYFQLQHRMTHQVEAIKAQARSNGEKIRFEITKRGGWPFGAWVKIDSPQFSQTEQEPFVSFLGTATRIGGTWEDWFKGFTRYHAVPFTLVGKNVIAISDEPYTAIIFLENVRFYKPTDRARNKGAKVPFSLQQIQFDLKKNDIPVNTLTLHEIKGIVKNNEGTDPQSASLALDASAERAETLIHNPGSPINLEISHMHLAFNALQDSHNPAFTLQDYSFQLPSMALPSTSHDKNTQEKSPIPAIALSGKFSPDTKSGELTLKVDAWRDLIKSTYHHFGKAITGEEISPFSEALLDKLLRSDHDDAEKPLVISASMRNGKMEKLDMGSLQPLFQLFADANNAASNAP